MIKIEDNEHYSGNKIGDGIFGLNYVVTYDAEFGTNDDMADLLESLNPSSLRYPGGGITEVFFSEIEYTENNWIEAFLQAELDGKTQLEHLTNYISVAANVGASVQIVLPTRIGFNQTAGEALLEGSYGQRTDISPQYLTLLEDLLQETIQIAGESGVAISSVEIGNEFWLGGQMTASEYALLATTILETLGPKFPALDFISQVTYSAGRYSPVEDSFAYVEEGGDRYEVIFAAEAPKGYQQVTIPGQGSGLGQTIQISEIFRDNSIALEYLDGIVDHVYFRRGFDGIDTERNFALSVIPDTFKSITSQDDIDVYVTEWSTRHEAGNQSSEGTNHTGLQYASSTLEAFYELVSNGVTDANFWPLTFGNANVDRRVLIDTSEADLTFGGAIFKMLSESVVGLTPVFDFEVSGTIDIHGFQDDYKLTMFASNRSVLDGVGVYQSATLDFSNFSTEGHKFITIQQLSEDGTTGVDVNANPVFQSTPGFMQEGATVAFDLDPWALSRIEIQNVTENSDEIYGSDSSDLIYGLGGDDQLFGQMGDDSISGNFGHDQIFGGLGNDVLKGGWGNDTIIGGGGNDKLFATYSDNYLSGGDGSDELTGSKGNNYLSGGSGSDSFQVFSGNNYVLGGDGNDSIFLNPSSETLQSGAYAFNAGSPSGLGTGEVLSLEAYDLFSNVIDGGDGYDSLFMSDRPEALFLDDMISPFYNGPELQSAGSTERAIQRLSGIEHVDAGGGDDLIDLTSHAFSMQGASIEISGGEGDDVIWGSDADETIRGGSGNDTLYGGAGENLFFGGDGADVFEFSVSLSENSVSDFNFYQGDKIHIFAGKNSDDFKIYWSTNMLNIEAEFEGLDGNVEALSIEVYLEDTVNIGAIAWEDYINFF